MTSEPILSARRLVRHFPARGGRVRAVDGVDVDLFSGSTHALVGESGSGKTTLSRLLTTLDRPQSGSVHVVGQDISSLGRAALRACRAQVQMVFQEPVTSLDPRLTARASVAESWAARGLGSGDERAHWATETLARVGLPRDRMGRRPGSLSGGECQRVAIARAIALEPALIVLDEPVSSLDMSIRAQILAMLADLQAELGMAYLLVSHDLAMVSQVAATVSVMYMGQIVERGPVTSVLESPQHPYTQALVSAVPTASTRPSTVRKRIVLAGDPPSPVNPPSGCRFRTRCWKAQDRCAQEEPTLHGDPHSVACHFPGK